MRYFFHCKCGLSYNHGESSPRPCPQCGAENKWFRMGSAGGFRGIGEHVSDALGIDPSQIGEAQRRFPDHKFTPDGRMILSGSKERSRVLKDLGFVDHGKYHRDPHKHPKFGEMA